MIDAKARAAAVVALLPLLAGCASESFGQRLQREGSELSSLGERYARGEKLIARGERKIAEGRKMRRRGEETISEGEALIDRGRALQGEAESTYRGYGLGRERRTVRRRQADG